MGRSPVSSLFLAMMMPPFWSLPLKGVCSACRPCVRAGAKGPGAANKKSRPCRDGMLPWCHPASSACGEPLCGAGQSGAWAGNGDLPARPSRAGPRSVCGSRIHSAPRQRRALTLPRLSVAPLGAYSPRSLPCTIECTGWRERCQLAGRGGTGPGAAGLLVRHASEGTGGVRAGAFLRTRTSRCIGVERRRARYGGHLADWAWRGLERRLIDTMGGGLL